MIPLDFVPEILILKSCMLIDMEDGGFVFDAVDEGNNSKLERLPVPKHRHLKLGCPVMLLKKLNANLVNGLRGIVTSISIETLKIQI